VTFLKNSIRLSCILTEMVWFPLPETAEFELYALIPFMFEFCWICVVIFDPKFYHSTNAKTTNQPLAAF